MFRSIDVPGIDSTDREWPISAWDTSRHEVPANSPSARRLLRNDLWIGLFLWVGLFAFYLAVQYGDFLGWDGRTMANVAHNIVERRQFLVTRDVTWWVNEFPDGNKSPFGIGLSLVLAPFWVIQRMVDRDHGYFLTLPNPMITATTAVVVYRIGVALGWRRVNAVVTALTFGALTTAPHYSIELFNEPAIGLCLTTAVLGLLRMREGCRRGTWMIGLAVGVACLFRYDSFLLVVPLAAAVPLFVDRAHLRRHWRRWLLPLFAPTVLAVIWTLYYNHYRSGSAFDLSTGGEFTTPLLVGLERQLLSPGKGFFWYSPVLIAAVPGLWLLWRRYRGLATIIVAIFVVRACYFANYYNPDGSVAWGPRYLTPMCPLLVLGVGEILQRTPSLAKQARVIVRVALGTLMLVGAVVTFAGLWVPYTYTLQVANDVPGWQAMPPGQLDEIKSELNDRQFNDWYWSPILLNLRRLNDAGHWSPPGFPLHWWEGGPSPTGVITLGLALMGASSAVAVALARDRRSPSGRRRGALVASRAPDAPAP